jgi:predicted RNase H-like nuclease
MAVKRNPYKFIAGITPCPGGWAVMSARLAAATVVCEEPFVLPTLLDVLDYKPKFDAAAIYVPIGFSDAPEGPYRACDREAMEMVGWPRAVGFRPVPSRAALAAKTRKEALQLEPWLTRDDLRRFPVLREVDEMFQPFHQRSFYSAHPDLSFYLLNGEQPLTTSPFHEEGVIERLALVRDKLNSVDHYIMATPPTGCSQVHLTQAAGLLWTARRAAGRAINRLPAEPEWDSTGLRMELVR